MIDEDEAAHGEAPFARSYDFFKHMTGIALVSLGGVFAFADGGGTRFEHRQLIVILSFIGLAGVTSLLMAAHLAGIEVKPEPREKVARTIRLAQGAASLLLSGGLGAFLYNFTPAILK
jgi:hypothetical protein